MEKNALPTGAAESPANEDNELMIEESVHINITARTHTESQAQNSIELLELSTRNGANSNGGSSLLSTRNGANSNGGSSLLNTFKPELKPLIETKPGSNLSRTDRHKSHAATPDAATFDQNYWQLLDFIGNDTIGKQHKDIFADISEEIRTNAEDIDLTKNKRPSPGRRIKTAIFKPQLSALGQEKIVLPEVMWKHVVFPDNKYALWWDYIVLFAIIITVLLVPFQIGVSAGMLLYQEGYGFLFLSAINAVFIFDTIFNFFRVKRTNSGTMIINHAHIIRHYLYGWFPIDLLACLPVDLVLRLLDNQNTAYINLLSLINLLRLARVFRLKRIIQNSSQLLMARLKMEEYLVLSCKLLIYILLFNHITACFMCYIALLQAGSFREEDLYNVDHPNWIQGYHNIVESTFDVGQQNNTLILQLAGEEINNIMGRYILAFYFSAMTTTSIGYGDVTAYTIPEYWCVSLIMLVSGFFWAYFLSECMVAVHQSSSARRIYHQKLSDANTLARLFDKNDSFEQTKKSHGYGRSFKDAVEEELVLFVFKQHSYGLCGTGTNIPIRELNPVIEGLPSRLRERVCLALIQRDLYKFDWLRHHSVTTSTLGWIAAHCELHQFEAGERIFFSKDTMKRGIYIMRRGIMTYKEMNCLRKQSMVVYCSDAVLFKDSILLKRGSKYIPPVTMYVLTFTEMVFIPRKAIKLLFKAHPETWVDFGRWAKLRGYLKYWARSKIERRLRNRYYLEDFSDDSLTDSGNFTDDDV